MSALLQWFGWTNVRHGCAIEHCEKPHENNRIATGLPNRARSIRQNNNLRGRGIDETTISPHYKRALSRRLARLWPGTCHSSLQLGTK